MTKAAKRALVPSGSALADDPRLVLEPRSVSAGGVVNTIGVRLQSVLDRQRARGQISDRQSFAGEQLYRLWALGVQGCRIDNKGCSAWTPAGYMDSQLDALKVYRRARQKIGAARWPLLFAVCIEDWTVARYANERGRNTNASQEVLRSALDDLADFLGL